MINIFLKNRMYEKFKQFRSFIVLVLLMFFTGIIINLHEQFRSEQIKSIKNILQNTYLQKTLISVSSSLKPRFEKLNHKVSAGETFQGILNKINLNEEEEKKILNFITKNKLKFKIYENQKIIFEIDNLTKKKNNKNNYSYK